MQNLFNRIALTSIHCPKNNIIEWRLWLIITLAGGEVLSGFSGNTNPAWELDALYFGVSALSIDDGVYYSAVNSKLKEGSFYLIEIALHYYTNLFGPIIIKPDHTHFALNIIASETINLAIATCQSHLIECVKRCFISK